MKEGQPSFVGACGHGRLGVWVGQAMRWAAICLQKCTLKLVQAGTDLLRFPHRDSDAEHTWLVWLSG